MGRDWVLVLAGVVTVLVLIAVAVVILRGG
jgi:hypothetical protein